MVATETYSGTGSKPGARERTGWSRWLPGRRLRVRFSKFAAGSVAATVLSQLTLTGLFWLGGVNATTASLVAFVAGAIPNFVVNWKWTWGRSGRPALVRELLPYIAIVVGGGLAATARRLLVLSASLSILALGLLATAVSICMSFLWAFGRLLSSVTSYASGEGRGDGR